VIPVPKTQREAVIMTLEKEGYITSWQAFTDWGITRLAAIVSDLRKEGKEIITESVKTENRYGHTVVYGKYILKKEEGQLKLL
jgi:hypothetical protein